MLYWDLCVRLFDIVDGFSNNAADCQCFTNQHYPIINYFGPNDYNFLEIIWPFFFLHLKGTDDPVFGVFCVVCFTSKFLSMYESQNTSCIFVLIPHSIPHFIQTLLNPVKPKPSNNRQKIVFIGPFNKNFKRIICIYENYFVSYLIRQTFVATNGSQHLFI